MYINKNLTNVRLTILSKIVSALYFIQHTLTRVINLGPTFFFKYNFFKFKYNFYLFKYNCLYLNKTFLFKKDARLVKKWNTANFTDNRKPNSS